MPDLTFYLQVFREPDHGRTALEQLRVAFPSARVIVYCDGGPERPEQIADLDVEYSRSDRRLFTHGGRAPHHMLALFLARPTDYLFKIDPDTVVHRDFRVALPTGCVFGTLQSVGQPDESVQGGAMGFCRRAAVRLYESALLLDPRLESDEVDLADDHLVRLASRRLRTGLGSFDWTIAWACKQLGIPLRSHGDIHSTWQHPCEEPAGTYALTHPRHQPARLERDVDAKTLRATLTFGRELQESP